ncbi:MAG: hypothetical protein FWC26_11720 [Fibromonadales bacterium]|nr:hypothetical protein [Fibromonadales bacterium]
MLRIHKLFILVALFLFWSCTHVFFDENVIDKCGGKDYTSASQICEDGILKNPCGNGYYDSIIQFCFENEIYDKCDGKSYNPTMVRCTKD